MDMTLQLIKGQFDSKDALILITKMIDAKIRFHESRINNLCGEEDVKMRENKIKALQKDLFEARKLIENCQSVNIASKIMVSKNS